ncbi:MAG: hypothetical protein JXD23_14275 [Spirochaetales bacterium]|nr:hypothetical protein [Spirochaetales bacterium]
MTLTSAGAGQTQLIQMNTTRAAGSSLKVLGDAVASTDMMLNFSGNEARILHSAFEIEIEP